jgi:hypothetical protein
MHRALSSIALTAVAVLALLLPLLQLLNDTQAG